LPPINNDGGVQGKSQQMGNGNTQKKNCDNT